MTEQVVTGKVRAVTLCCLLSHTKTVYLSGNGSGYETIVSNNDDVILLSVTLYVAQKWNRSCQVSTLHFS